MAANTARVNCINKTNRTSASERISHIGGPAGGGWRLTTDDAIAKIEQREWDFFTEVDGKSVWLIVAKSAHGHKYLKTEADGEQPNNLLSLPECRA